MSQPEPLTPAAIAELREMLGKAQLPWTSKLFGVTRGASWGHIAISAVNALPALLDAAEDVERLRKALISSRNGTDNDGPCWCRNTRRGVTKAHCAYCTANRAALAPRGEREEP